MATATMDKNAAIARIRAAMEREATSDTRVTDPADVPLSAESLTVEWLDAVLCRNAPGANVEGFALVGEDDRGTTARRIVTIAYNPAGQEAGLPTRLFVKATPEFDSRFVCGLSGAIAHEVNFYNRLAPLLDMEIPRCFHADYDPESFRSIFLFEDAVETKGAQFLSGLYRPTREEIERMVRELAKVHGRFWGDPRLDSEFIWLKDALDYQYHIDDLIGFRERTAIGLERSMDLLPASVAARADAFWPALFTACTLRIEAPRTLLHADDHLGNWYITGTGQPGVCDWQCTQKGQWAADFAYLVTSSLDPEDRRAWEKDLLSAYLDALGLPAGVCPDFHAAWLAYRQQTLHGLYNWLFVAGIGDGQTLMHSGDIAQSNLVRMASAVGDLDTLGALGA